MIFSSRTPADLGPNRLSRAMAGRAHASRPVVDLTVSNPTRADFIYPDDLLAPLGHARGLRYAPEPFGLLEARRAVAEDFEGRGARVDAAQVALTASTSEAYSLLFKILCDPGDDVLVPHPSYPLFEHLTRLDAVRAIPYALECHGRWSIDLSSVERGLGPRTRALLIVNPNNPTGNFTSTGELEAIARLCAARDIAVISDEVFADYSLVSDASLRRGRLSDRQDVLGFTLGGLSKSIGLPQVKLGWIAVSGRHASEACLRLELACDTYLSVSTPAQAAIRDLLVRGMPVRRQIQHRVRANHATLVGRVADTPSCRVLECEGGWYAVLQVPTLMSEEDLVLALLEQEDVLVHPGYFFDFPTESFLIVSLLTPEREFLEGASRILGYFDRAARLLP